MKQTYWLFLFLLFSCTVQKVKKSVYDSEVFQKGHMGFMLYDPVKEKTLVSLNEKKYFIPASNTKIFTFYTSYKTLGDGLVNGLNYIQKNDSLIFWGTGDPSLLHPDLKDSTALVFLKNRPEKLYMVNNFDQVSGYGPGWTWNWYPYYFAAERSSMPIYGNVLRYSKEAEGTLANAYPNTRFLPLTRQMAGMPERYAIRRDIEKNIFYYALNKEVKDLSFETDKPFITSPDLAKNLLQEAVDRQITLIEDKDLYSMPHQKLPTARADSIYAQMMKISDNFLAEQLMVMVSDELFDSLNMSAAIKYAKDSLLNDLPDEPQWVDGSGLSPQNMFTPRSVVKLLDKIMDEIPMEKIKAYFPAGGESGTIRNWYPADPGEPAYIYAKTGTLSMSSALSGYLITKSGKTLIFSTFFNNYTGSSNVQKAELQEVLYYIHNNY